MRFFEYFSKIKGNRQYKKFNILKVLFDKLWAWSKEQLMNPAIFLLYS
jgi:hypothetical protein